MIRKALNVHADGKMQTEHWYIIFGAHYALLTKNIMFEFWFIEMTP